MWMVDARMDMERGAWRRFAILAVGIFEPNRDKRKRPRPFDLVDFDPYFEKEGGARGVRLTRENIKTFKPLFEK